MSPMRRLLLIPVFAGAAAAIALAQTPAAPAAIVLKPARVFDGQTLLAGFTTIRDLGTEGAGYADAGLKQAVDQGIIPGPRMLVSTRAIVATGSYQPKFIPEWLGPQGAREAHGGDR